MEAAASHDNVVLCTGTSYGLRMSFVLLVQLDDCSLLKPTLLSSSSSNIAQAKGSYLANRRLVESVQLKAKQFCLSSSLGRLPPRVSSKDTIEENKNNTKLKQGLRVVPIGKSRPGIRQRSRTFPPE